MDYKEELYEKMTSEQEKYRDWLLSQPPSEILNHTYEYTMREDIIIAVDEMDISQKQARALLMKQEFLYQKHKQFSIWSK